MYYLLYYSLFYFGLHHINIYVTNENPRLMQCISNILTNFVIVSLPLFYDQPTNAVCIQYGSMIMIHYLYDTILYFYYQELPDKYLYVLHHVAALSLISKYMMGSISCESGAFLLLLFEYSNTCLNIWFLFHILKLKVLRNIVAYPFSLTYIPIRTVIIPIFSYYYVRYELLYSPSLTNLEIWNILCLFVFLNVFSVVFGVIVTIYFTQMVYRHLRIVVGR